MLSVYLSYSLSFLKFILCIIYMYIPIKVAPPVSGLEIIHIFNYIILIFHVSPLGYVLPVVSVRED